FGVRPALNMDEGAGELAARAVFARFGSRAALTLVDALLAISTEAGPRPSASNGSVNGHGNGSGNGSVNGSGNGSVNGDHDAELLEDLIAGAFRANGSHPVRE